MWFRCVLPFRPLSDDGRRRLAGPHRRLAHLGRPRPGNQPDPLGHPGLVVHVPLAGRPRHRGGPGGRHERRSYRARARYWLVRGGAHGLRHPLSATGRALRASRRAARDHHRLVGHPGRREVLLQREALRTGGQPRPAQAGAAPAPAGDHRWRRCRANPSSGGDVRRRIQPPSTAWPRPKHSSPGCVRPASRRAAIPRHWVSRPPRSSVAAPTKPAVPPGPGDRA